MGYMASVDIVLNEYKLSDAQKNAVVELLSGGFYTAKANTIGSLVKKGIVVVNESGSHELEETFHAKVREAYSQPEARTEDELSFHESLMSDVAELESFAEILGQDPAELHESVEETLYPAPEDGGPVLPERTEYTISPDTFDKQWALWERELMGFDIPSRWTNVEAWHGLTAQQIRDDMDTEHYVNRAARRGGAKMTRRAVKAFAKRGV